MCWCFVRVDIDVVAHRVYCRGFSIRLSRIFHTVSYNNSIGDIFCIAFANGMNKSMSESEEEKINNRNEHSENEMESETEYKSLWT